MVQAAKGWLRSLADESGWAWIAFFCVLSGIGVVLDPGQLAPMIISQAFSTAVVIGWGASLILGGTNIFAGITVNRGRVERFGLAWLGYAILMYWLATWAFTPWQATRLSVGFVYLSILIAIVARYRKVGRVLAAINKAREVQERERQHRPGGDAP